MKVVYLHSSYKPNDLIGGWFRETKRYMQSHGGNAWIGIKFRHEGIQTDDIIIGDSISCGIHVRLFNFFGLQDMWSYFATRKFLKRLDEIKPDIIHCHVINDCFLHMGLFCMYVNKHNIKVVWTFHDARVLTGMCPCPMFTGCDKFKTSCGNCPKNDRFITPSHEIVNLSNIVHWYRKRTIGKIKNLTIATPSKWMAGLVKQSYLKEMKCVVINNGINHNVFKPVEQNIRSRYGIAIDKKLLLCVGNPIGKLKGQEYLHQLADELPKDKYVLVMVGCINVDVEKFKNIENVIAFPRVDRDDLIAFYNAADLFVNPTLADNFPTVNLEAQACGCPVIAFDTDGTPETIDPEHGVVVPRKNYDALRDAILNFNYEGARESAIRFASQYSQERCVDEYIKLYESL